MDTLDNILRSINLRGSMYFDACFGSPWGMDLGQFPHSVFHIMVKGDAWLQMSCPQGDTTKLAAGDIVIFPNRSTS